MRRSPDASPELTRPISDCFQQTLQRGSMPSFPLQLAENLVNRAVQAGVNDPSLQVCPKHVARNRFGQLRPRLSARRFSLSV